MRAFPQSLLMIGCGNMAGAMLSRWLEQGLDPAHVTVVDPARAEPPASGVKLLSHPPESLSADSVIILGFKPQMLGEIAPRLKALAAQASVVVSMLAGVDVTVLGGQLGGQAPVVRVMPNLPVALGRGVCGLYADASLPEPARSMIDALMHPLGLVEWLDTEDQFNLLTAVSGCGPAFLYRFIDTMAAAAQSLGMEADQAQRLALATVDGAAGLAAASGESPALLADRVASPGGMTREGLDVMDQDGRMLTLMQDVLKAARDRGEALAAMAASQ